MRENTLKRALQERRAAFGTWLGFNSALVAERLASLGFDWLLIDLEHSAANHETAAMMALAIAARGSVPLVRVPSSADDHIKRALDLGAYGIVAPMVNSMEQARSVVASCSYPPAGVRSVAGGRNDLAWETTGPTYLAQANQRIAVIVQIEHVSALDKLDEILSVPGIDCAFIGPQDLSASLGLAPMLESPEPRYQEAVALIKAAADRQNVATGIMVLTPEQAARRAEQGFSMIALANEVRILTAAVTEIMAKLRG